ncbi:MAG: cadmium-translocating P-type ATPase [Ruminococcaceae bacterium]|nr:cadmium-translocating P-type ATPase [Oscillospiraceae bacterium]
MSHEHHHDHHHHDHCSCEHDHHDHCHCDHDHHDHHEHHGEGCACCEAKLHGEVKVEKAILYRIAFSSVLFLAGFFLSGWLLAGCFLVAYGIIAWDILWAAAKNICRGKVFDEQFLMAIASIGAFCIGEYPEAVAVMLFYQIGETFQTLAASKSRASIAGLMELRPDRATVLRDEEEMTVSPENVAVGEIIVVRPGERIPLDGTVLQGSSNIDNSALTGESVPRFVKVGARVLSGGVNQTGVLQIRTESLYAQSTAAKILELVEHASEKKAKSERFITRFSRWYTPCVVIGAALLAFIPPIFVGNLSGWVHRALVFLVVSCPCALVVSVPLSFVGGIGGAARRGILIKGADALEALSKVNTVAFDKTGTLTTGVFQPKEICPVEISQEELEEIAAALEKHSTHPIARCLAVLGNKSAENVQETAGGGVSGVVDGKLCFAGSRRFLEKMGITVPQSLGNGTVIHIAREGTYLGYITARDVLRPDAKEAVAILEDREIQTLMLTGDHPDIAQRVGDDIGIKKIYSQLLPQDKVIVLEEEMAKKRRVAVIGDGINDAPILARGDVGIAMGGIGSDAAIEAAGVVLMEDKLTKIPEAIALSQKTMTIVKQNILFALGAKGIILILGALGIANMWIAVFGDVGVMILATLNALRSYLWKK